MKITFATFTAAMLAIAPTIAIAKDGPTLPQHRAHHRSAAKPPSIESQIEALREQLQAQGGQIEALKQQLSERDAQLQQAQQSAVQAHQAAQAAQQAANDHQQTVTSNEQAVSTLQGSVSDLRASTSSTASTVAHVEERQAQVQHQIDNPDAIHYKGITLSPSGSFVEFATVDRNHATGSDIPTPFSSIPFPGSDAYNLSEFEMTGRQSRLALTAEGRVGNGVIRGYWEADWLGAGVTSNNNQSNSYLLRQRVLYAQDQLNSGWLFTGGQQWSLVTEYTKGLFNKSEAVPYTIDPNYQVGFVWTRQPGLHIVKDFGGKAAFGVAIENDQMLAPSCQSSGIGATACPTNYLFGTPGNGSGGYNGGGAPGTPSVSLANYSYNLGPMFVAKVAFDPTLGHFELFGVSRFFRDRIYPNAGAATPSAAGAYNSDKVGGGGGASARFHLKGMDLGLKGLYGDGTGRLGDSALSDVTVRPDGTLSPLHAMSGMAFLEGHATLRLDLYAYYGGDYVGRDYVTNSATGGETGYGTYGEKLTGCTTEVLPGTGTGTGTLPGSASSCGASSKDIQEYTLGYWYNFFAGPHGRLRQGLQYSHVQRYLWGDQGMSPNTSDNVIETSFRYYVP